MHFEVYYSCSKYSDLCFMHAVEMANLGESISTHITDSSYYYGYCKRCSEETHDYLHGIVPDSLKKEREANESGRTTGITPRDRTTKRPKTHRTKGN